MRGTLIRLTPAELDGLVESLLLDAEPTPGRLAVHGVARDPRDDMFLGCAVEGHADHIVSGDRDLLALRYENVSIVTTIEFLKIVARAR